MSMFLAQVVATPESTPERFTPMLYRVQHPLVKFSGSRLVSLIDGEDGEAPRCTITSVQVKVKAKKQYNYGWWLILILCRTLFNCF